MARVCDRQGKTYLLRTLGNNVPGSGHEVWDVTDPARPQKTSTVVSGLTSTHKSWWECDTGIAYLVSGDLAKTNPLQLGPSGWRTGRMTKIYDLSDPAKPALDGARGRRRGERWLLLGGDGALRQLQNVHRSLPDGDFRDCRRRLRDSSAPRWVAKSSGSTWRAWKAAPSFSRRKALEV